MTQQSWGGKVPCEFIHVRRRHTKTTQKLVVEQMETRGNEGERPSPRAAEEVKELAARHRGSSSKKLEEREGGGWWWEEASHIRSAAAFRLPIEKRANHSVRPIEEQQGTSFIATIGDRDVVRIHDERDYDTTT